MNAPAELDRLTLELCAAAVSEELDPALELLAHRQKAIDSLEPRTAGGLRSILASGAQAIAGLRERRDRLARALNDLRQSRGRLDSFRPARTPRRRLDLEM